MRLTNVRCLVSTCLAAHGVAYKVLKLGLFVRVGLELTFAIAYATGNSEKNLFCLLRSETHKYLNNDMN